ncbi:MAG: deoxynucleoside kinase [Acidobacteria bacterium]|nr:deoxynucleoside kinase [Acidobacteriota bacterium]
MTPPHFIAIEGPVRVGKTSLARLVAERLRARLLLDNENNPFLKGFYTVRPGAAFQAQMFFLIERFRQLKNASIATSRSPVVADYLFEKDKIFACINLGDEELGVYDQYYDLLKEQLPTPDLVIYLQASPEVLRRRIARKDIASEANISDEYLIEVGKAYEHFFSHYRASDVLVINTTELDFVERSRDLEELLRGLTQPIKGTQFFPSRRLGVEPAKVPGNRSLVVNPCGQGVSSTQRPKSRDHGCP